MKQIIVMRKDLGMRAGKMVAQGAHASLAVVLDHLGDPRVEEWLQNSFTKVCVRVDSLMELMNVADAAEEAGLMRVVITDNGKTEFNGIPTITCLAVGPDTAENLAPVTGHLKLL
jgi:PTH2 family peptidyl-tRNA hydrolase